jgi:hypothetical protein
MRTIVLWGGIAALLLAGCSGDRDIANGLRGKLAFHPVGLGAVGGPLLVYVSHGRIRGGACETRPGSLGPELSCPSSQLSVTEILEVDCEGIGCTVVSTEVVHEARIDLRVTEPGFARLRVRLRFENGDVESDELDVEFVEATRIDVTCLTAPHRIDYCTGPHAVFVGQPLHWTFAAMAERADGTVVELASAPTVTTVGDVVEWVPGFSEAEVLRAMAPGTGTVRVRFGTLEREIPVRVADPSEVASIAIRRWRVPADAVDIAYDPLTAEPAPSVLYAASSPSLPNYEGAPGEDELGGLVLVSTLADGTLAIGSASALQSADTDLVEVYHLDSEYSESDDWTLAGGFFRLIVRQPGTTTLDVSLGPTTMSWPVEVVRHPDETL